MKNRPKEKSAAHLADELDELHARLNEVRAESQRLTASRAATERKLEAIGKNLAGLKNALAKVVTTKPRPTK